MCHFPSSSKHGTTWWYNTELTSIIDYNIETLKTTTIFFFYFQWGIEGRHWGKTNFFFINSIQSFLLQDLKKVLIPSKLTHAFRNSPPINHLLWKKNIFVVLKVCCNLLDMIQIFLNKKSASKTQIQRRFNHLWLSWFFYYVDYCWRLWKY